MGRTGTAVHALLHQSVLLRALGAFLLFVLSEYAVWIGMLVYAYSRGGATSAGLVALAQLLPGVVAAPLLSTLADRHPPGRLLAVGYLVQSLAMAATAAAIYAGAAPVVAYAAAVVAATAVTATRPAQATVLPALARSADGLAAANAAQGWADAVGVVVAGLLAGVCLASGQAGLVFAICALAVLGSVLLVTGLHVPPMQVDDDEGGGTIGAVVAGLHVLRTRPQPRLLVALSTACYVVLGALDVLFVVLAVSVLHRGAEWTGYLNTAEGLGGVAAGAISFALLGRRLTRPIQCATALFGVALAAAAFSTETALTATLLALCGAARSVLDVAIRTLLQRSVPSELLGRIFGVVEGLSMAGMAVGSVLVPALIAIGGPRTALIGTAVILPAALLVGGRTVIDLDGQAHRPVVEIALLRALPHFHLLPTPATEGLAQAVERVSYRDGEVIIRQGDVGDRFYAIAEGTVRVFVDGTQIASRSRPDGLGEIALLRRVPRSATVVADGPVVLYALDGDRFLTVVTGHSATRREAEAVATAHLSRDRRPG